MRRLFVAAAVALLSVSVAAPAAAVDGAALDAAKKLTTARIDGRLATLKAEVLPSATLPG